MKSSAESLKSSAECLKARPRVCVTTRPMLSQSATVKLEDKDNAVLEEVRKLNESLSNLHAELAVTKNTNNLLLTRLTTMERQCWANARYSRRECLNIAGIPREVSGEIM